MSEIEVFMSTAVSTAWSSKRSTKQVRLPFAKDSESPHETTSDTIVLSPAE